MPVNNFRIQLFSRGGGRQFIMNLDKTWESFNRKLTCDKVWDSIKKKNNW